MNLEQILSITRSALQIVGTVLVTFKIAGMTDATWAPIAGGILMIVPVVWGIHAHSDASAVAVVGNMASDPHSPVKAVMIEPTTEGRALVTATANPKVMVAGTSAAEAAAKK